MWPPWVVRSDRALDLARCTSNPNLPKNTTRSSTSSINPHFLRLSPAPSLALTHVPVLISDQSSHLNFSAALIIFHISVCNNNSRFLVVVSGQSLKDPGGFSRRHQLLGFVLLLLFGALGCCCFLGVLQRWGGFGR